MKYGGRCNNVHLQIDQYKLKSHMISINMGGCEIVLCAKWIDTLGPITMDFKDLTMQFQHKGHKYKFQGIITFSSEIIISHCKENLLKKFHAGIISQHHSIQKVETPFVHSNLQYILSQHHIVFQTPQGLFPSCVDHDHSIPLILGILLPNGNPYHHPFSQKNEIEKIFQEFIEVDVIYVPTPILPLFSWSSRRKELGACVLIFVPSKKLPSRINFPFMS
jgi:hypothetical protein